jgi:hypothetical protein
MACRTRSRSLGGADDSINIGGKIEDYYKMLGNHSSIGQEHLN